MMGEEEKKITEISQVRCQKRAMGPKAGQPKRQDVTQLKL